MRELYRYLHLISCLRLRFKIERLKKKNLKKSALNLCVIKKQHPRTLFPGNAITKLTGAVDRKSVTIFFSGRQEVETSSLHP